MDLIESKWHTSTSEHAWSSLAGCLFLSWMCPSGNKERIVRVRNRGALQCLTYRGSPYLARALLRSSPPQSATCWQTIKLSKSRGTSACLALMDPTSLLLTVSCTINDFMPSGICGRKHCVLERGARGGIDFLRCALILYNLTLWRAWWTIPSGFTGPTDWCWQDNMGQCDTHSRVPDIAGYSWVTGCISAGLPLKASLQEKNRRLVSKGHRNWLAGARHLSALPRGEFPEASLMLWCS